MAADYSILLKIFEKVGVVFYSNCFQCFHCFREQEYTSSYISIFDTTTATTKIFGTCGAENIIWLTFKTGFFCLCMYYTAFFKKLCFLHDKRKIESMTKTYLLFSSTYLIPTFSENRTFSVTDK